MQNNWIAILDFGSQYTQLIARRIREQQVYSEILPFNTTAQRLRERKPAGIILSGGSNSAAAGRSLCCDPAIFKMSIPVLGICVNMQLPPQTLHGSVTPEVQRGYKNVTIKTTPDCELFEGLPEEISVWMNPDDWLTDFNSCACAAMCDTENRFYALQFHPEVTRTEYGREILHNYLFKICACAGDWKLPAFIKERVAAIRTQVGETDEVILGLSGGVDSSVVAALIHRAIGKRLHCIFVDNGLLRYGEDVQVQEMFEDKLGMDLHVIDAKEQFYAALKGVTDPEKKRKIIGHEFVKVFADQARRFKNSKFLAQGTIYPDVIESVNPQGGPSVAIKSHHNVGGLPDDLHFELVEPLRELFKDEVRAVGREMGLDHALLDRQPFPGPGMGVRILGEVTAERVHLLQQADMRVQEEMIKLPNYTEIWQSFAVLLPVKSVGVMNDQRTYENVCAIRSVDSIDAMTAEWTRIPYETLACISNRIINEVRGINRVVYDISSKPPATIEWE